MAAIKLESYPPRPLVAPYTPFPIPGWKFGPGGDCGSCFCSSKRSPVTDIDFYGGHCLLCVMNVFVERWPAIKISNGDKCNVPREQRNALPPVLSNVLARCPFSPTFPPFRIIVNYASSRKRRNLLDEAY